LGEAARGLTVGSYGYGTPEENERAVFEYFASGAYREEMAPGTAK